MRIFQLSGLEEAVEILGHHDLWTQFKMRIKIIWATSVKNLTDKLFASLECYEGWIGS